MIIRMLHPKMGPGTSPGGRHGSCRLARTAQVLKTLRFPLLLRPAGRLSFLSQRTLIGSPDTGIMCVFPRKYQRLRPERASDCSHSNIVPPQHPNYPIVHFTPTHCLGEPVSYVTFSMVSSVRLRRADRCAPSEKSVR